MLLLALSFSLTGQKTEMSQVNTEFHKGGPSIDERLQKHFSAYEIRPSFVINNDDFGIVKSKLRTITFANHKIVWITVATNRDVETTIKIDKGGKGATLELIDYAATKATFHKRWQAAEPGKFQSILSLAERENSPPEPKHKAR